MSMFAIGYFILITIVVLISFCISNCRIGRTWVGRTIGKWAFFIRVFISRGRG